MPQRTFKTSTVAAATLSGGVTLNGRVWEVQPLLPSPLDATAQAATYRAANTSKSLNANVWLGVQYAQHPVEGLRFKPAQPFTYTAGTYECVDHPAPPYQSYVDELGRDGRTDLGQPTVGTYDWIGMGTRESESIATANVYTPDTPGPHPVILQIHGGGYGVYHAMGPQQYGHRLATHKGCAVVTVEYPLSVFGNAVFPETLTMAEPSTVYTFVKTALKWVHDNIAAFGGDPDRVCIAGTSAGGALVQMLMTDDDTQGWFSSAWIGSGGGLGVYMGPDSWGNGFIWRGMTHEKALRAAAPFLSSLDTQFRTVQQAIDANGFLWALQHAFRPEHIMALADRGRDLQAASVRAVVAGTGNLQWGFREATENVYAFKRTEYANAVAAAKAGKFRKPFVALFAECEALNLLGGDYVTIRDTLRAMVASNSPAFDNWAQNLGYANYEDWLNAPWQPPGGFGSLSTAQFNPATDPLAIGLEPLRVLYTHTFMWPAARAARAATDTGSATAWLVGNNFSANSIWAGHSMEVPLMLGNPIWNVAGLQNFPLANPPGIYENARMDLLYVSEILMQMIAALAATGDPGGAWSYAGFDLFDGNPPADGGSLTVDPQSFTPEYVNLIGKYADPVDTMNNLNAGTFFPGTPVIDLDSQRDAKMQHVRYMVPAMAAYLSKLG